MAREELEREDLLREATGLVDRMEVTVPWLDEPLVWGFRRNGAPSFFLGQNEVYQFTSDGEFRRGYLAGRLLKAEEGRMVFLHRERTDENTFLVRTEMDDAEHAAILQQMAEQLSRIQTSLERTDFQEVGRVQSQSEDVVSDVVAWLHKLPQPIRVARTPRVK